MGNYNKKISTIVSKKISNDYHDNKKILSALQLLLNRNYKKYEINENYISNEILTDESFQNILSHINEKSTIQKD